MSKVSLVKCSEYELSSLKEAINLSLESIGGVDKFAKKGAKVLLKPNVMMPKKSSFPVNTHPLFIQAVIEIFKEKGAKIIVGESSAGSQAGITFTKKALKTSGIEDVVNKTGAKLVNFDFDEVIMTKINNPYAKSIPIAKAVLEADLVVSLPKLKTHIYGNIITGAIKNMYGTVPGQIKAEYHRLAPEPEQFYTIIRDIFKATKTGLTIFDAIEAMEGDGPSAGKPRYVGFIIASEDSVAANAVASELVGIPSLRVLTTKFCAEANIGKGNLKEIEVVGEELKKVALKNFKLPTSTVINPYLYRFILNMTKTQPVINHKKCSLCQICADSCPMGVIEEKEKKMIINYDECISCFCCSEVCPSQAIKAKRKFIIGNILSKVISSRW